MKFTAKALSALTAAGLLVGTLSVPAFAAEKKEKTLIDYIDVDAHMLTTNDPFPPGSATEYSSALPLTDGPGVGVPLIEI